MNISPFFQYSLLALPTITKSSGSRGMDWFGSAVVYSRNMWISMGPKTADFQSKINSLDFGALQYIKAPPKACQGVVFQLMVG